MSTRDQQVLFYDLVGTLQETTFFERAVIFGILSAYSEPFQTSTMDCFVKIIHSYI